MLCCSFTAGYAQAPQAAGAISGMITDSSGMSAIRRAIVTLSTVESVPQDAVAWTDSNGRFTFAYLPAGRYQLRVTKEGFQAAAFGQETAGRPPSIITLASGEFRNDIVFHLQRLPSISGVVLDDDGEPLANAQVMAMREGFQRGKRALLPGMSTMTDSTGHYALSGLAAGRYAVVANYQNGRVVKIHPDVAVGEAQSQYSYAAQYYPGTTGAESATMLTVQPGQEISQIDFRLTARQSAILQGKVIVPESASAVRDLMVNIVSEEFGHRMITGYGAGPPEFRFGGAQLPPGSYLLVAHGTVDGRSYRGVQKVELGAQGATDIAIPLDTPVDLAGTVKVEGPDANKHPASFVNLVPGDGIPWNASPLRGNVNKDGSFKINGVPPGVWDIGAGPIPPGGYIKSMRLGDQDVLTEEMMIRSSTTDPLNIVIGTHAAAIEGEVVRGDQPARASVVLAPNGKFQHVASFYRLAAADEKGHFEIKNATPGEYRLYAFEELNPQSMQDPDYLKPFESRGVPVTLREGPNSSQKLSVISPSIQTQERQ